MADQKSQIREWPPADGVKELDFAFATYSPLVAVLTWSLRIATYIFLRHHPIGPKYLPFIIFGICIYMVLTGIYLLFVPSFHPHSRSIKPWHMFLFGWVSRDRPYLSLAAQGTNLLCGLLVLDFIYRGFYLHRGEDLHFSRVGHVTISSASVVIRVAEPRAIELQLRATSDERSPWVVGDVIQLHVDNDWTGTFQLEDLNPGTEYLYRTNASHTGSFKTARPDVKRFTFVSTSCIKPFYPYNPVDHALRIKGLEYLGHFASSRTIDFVLFLGDFIYIDLPYPIGWSRYHYTLLYRQVYASPSWSSLLKSIPWIHVYDDHELVNDYHSEHQRPTAGKEGALNLSSERFYNEALQPYQHYQGQANPKSQYGKTYFTFKHGDIAFFVLDTRRYRSPPNTPDVKGEKTMLGAQQLDDLRVWLETEQSWKVVVSSVPFTRNWRGPDSDDAWGGYLTERKVVFDMMRETEGVVILSGDRHEHATTMFPDPLSDSAGDDPRGEPQDGRNIVEFSTSALNQFFEPFEHHHRQVEDTDIAIHNFWKGNSKFAAITFDTSSPTQWTTHFELHIDGKLEWTYDWTFRRQKEVVPTPFGVESLA